MKTSYLWWISREEDVGTYISGGAQGKGWGAPWTSLHMDFPVYSCSFRGMPALLAQHIPYLAGSALLKHEQPRFGDQG